MILQSRFVFRRKQSLFVGNQPVTILTMPGQYDRPIGTNYTDKVNLFFKIETNKNFLYYGKFSFLVMLQVSG